MGKHMGQVDGKIALVTGAAMGIVVVVGGALVLDDALDIGVRVAFLFYVQRFFDPIRSLTIQYSVMQRAMASPQANNAFAAKAFGRAISSALVASNASRS